VGEGGVVVDGVFLVRGGAGLIEAGGTLPLQIVEYVLRRHHSLVEQRCRHAVTGHHDERDPALGGGVGGVRDRAGGGGGAVDADDDGVLEGCHTPRLPLFATVGRRIYRSSGNGELDG